MLNKYIAQETSYPPLSHSISNYTAKQCLHGDIHALLSRKSYSLPFTLVVTEGSEGNKAGVFQFRTEYRNHRKVIGRVKIRIYKSSHLSAKHMH